MKELRISADDLVESLLGLPAEDNLCLLDSCGTTSSDSNLLTAGIRPYEIIEIKNETLERSLSILDDIFSAPDLKAIFTISYDFGVRLNKLTSRHEESDEPDIFLALFDVLITHDYKTKRTYLTGNEERFAEIENHLLSASNFDRSSPPQRAKISSNFTKTEYLRSIETIKELIRSGDTYQTNLTQQIKAQLPDSLSPEMIFLRLRRSNPARYSSFIRRKDDVIISTSPERFFKVENDLISTSPIKGTRPRGKNAREDRRLRNELVNSEKDIAENVMIVDLLRNDLGRICRFGTIRVETLHSLEVFPTLFHLVSTVSGRLRENIDFSEILRATFPCGSITGAPKIRTMEIIDQIETASRGISMGAIGFAIQDPMLQLRRTFDLSVAIRTLAVRGNELTFNVGGGIVIDSLPDLEYEETLVKSRALLHAINADEKDLGS